MKTFNIWQKPLLCPRSYIAFWGIIILGVFLYTPIISAKTEEFKLPERFGPKGFDYEIIDAFVKSGQKGILTAFKGNPDMRGTHLQTAYYMKDGQSFKGDFMIGNYTDNTIDYTIICLIDYKQQKFLFNGKRGSTHSVSIKSGERVIYPLTVVDIKKGAHDFLLLAVRMFKASDKPEDIEYSILFHRANIFVESYSFPQVIYSKFAQQPSKLQASQIVVNKSKQFNDFKELFFDIFPFSKDFQYYLHVNNQYSDILPYAVILFIDSKQLSYESSYSGNKDMLYYFLEPKSQSVIMIKIPSINRIRSLWAISIENPYARLETESGIMAQIPNFVRISNVIRYYK